MGGPTAGAVPAAGCGRAEPGQQLMSRAWHCPSAFTNLEQRGLEPLGESCWFALLTSGRSLQG